MKKIAFYIESMIVGGAERVLLNLVNNMDCDKYDVTVISIFKTSVYKNYNKTFEGQLNENIKYRYLVDNTDKLAYTFFNYSFAHFSREKIYSRLVKEKYDVEVAFYEGLPTLFVAASTNPDSVKIAWLHTARPSLYEQMSPGERAERQRTYEKYDCIAAVSDGVKNNFLNYFPGLKVKTVYNIVNIPEEYHGALAESESYPRFLMVGRLIKSKGYPVLLNAAERLKNEGHVFKVDILGDGEEREALEGLIVEKHLEDFVKLLGNVQNPCEYMTKSDYLVSASTVEGLSTVAIEAILCGLPVLTARVSGMDEIFGDCRCGVICENSEDGIYNMLLSAIQSPQTRKIYQSECEKRRPFFSVPERMRAYDRLFRGEFEFI